MQNQTCGSPQDAAKGLCLASWCLLNDIVAQRYNYTEDTHFTGASREQLSPIRKIIRWMFFFIRMNAMMPHNEHLEEFFALQFHSDKLR